MKACTERQNGFTLIEVLIAIVILTVGILAAALMQVSALGGNSLASRTTQASTLAGGAIEELMSTAYNDPLLAATVTGDLVSPDDASILTPALGDIQNVTVPAQQPEGFEIFWQVKDDYPFVDCKTIRVIVRRADKGVMRTVSLDTIRARPM
jgi:prepilin-type N-terminal cleavage/methylation domain-containing protein